MTFSHFIFCLLVVFFIWVILDYIHYRKRLERLENELKHFERSMVMFENKCDTVYTEMVLLKRDLNERGLLNERYNID